MNKKLIIGIIIVLVIIGVVWKMNSNKQVEDTQQEVIDNTPSPEEVAAQEANQLIDDAVVDDSDAGEVDLGDVI